MVAPPRGQSRQAQVLTEQCLRQVRQSGFERGAFDHPAADGIGHHDVPAARRVQQPGNAHALRGTQFKRVCVLGRNAPDHQVHALKPFERLHEYPALAHREVGAFDHGVTKITPHQGVFEIVWLVGATRENDRAMLVPDLGEVIGKAAEKTGQSMQVVGGKGLGNAA
jgi:hypothetical protein